MTGAVAKGSMALLVLAALLAAHAVVNYWWLQQDNHTLWLDEQVHQEQARAYSAALFLSPETPLLQRLETAFATQPGNPAHPPLLYLCGAVAQGVLGQTPDNATLVNTAAFLLLLLGLFLIARRFLPHSGALFVTAVAGFIPGLSVCSRYFMTDYPAACLVIWAMYALMRSEGFHNTRWSLAFGLFNALALLTRTVTPVYYLAPLLMVLVMGFLRCLGGGLLKDEKRSSFGRWCLHLLAVGVISLALAAPWYLYHKDAFLGYWVGHRGTTMQPFTFSDYLPKIAAPGAAAAEDAAAPAEKAAPVAADPAAAQPKAGLESSPAPVKEAEILETHTPWVRYPVFVLNNGMFLIPCLLAGLGAFCLLFIPRQYWFTYFLLLGWILGSWALFSLLFRFGTPRYAVPVLAPLALLSAMPILVIANTNVRHALCAVYLAVLAVPWAGLTFFTLPDVSAPWRPDPVMMDAYDEQGLYVAKNRLTLGNAYAWLGAPVRESYQDRMYLAMMREEAAVNRPEGQYASYAVLNLRGMGYQDKQYWPEPNPYRGRNLPADIAGVKSRICLAAHARDLTELELHAAGVSYVVYALEEDRSSEEESWRAWLTAQGFKELDRFSEPRRATNPGFLFGVWSHTAQAAAAAAISKEAVDTLGIVPLLQAFGVSNGFASDDALQSAQNRLTNLLAEADKTAVPLSNALAVTAFTVEPQPNGASKLNFVFNVAAALDKQYMIVLKDVAGPGVETPFQPVPSTREWAPGSYMLISWEGTVAAPPAALQMRLAAGNAATPWASVPWPKQ